MSWIGIDTATGSGSVALLGADDRIAVRNLEQRGAHARELLDVIDRLLRGAQESPPDLSGIGVAVGPGSFTGVRVGMATAKGLALALDISLVGLSTLEAMARAATMEASNDIPCLCSVLPAGRGEVYAARFMYAGGVLLRRAPDCSWTPAALRRDLPADAILAGDDLDPVMRSDPDLSCFTLLQAPPRAVAIARWAASVIPAGARYQPGTPVPNYIRPSDAEAARGRA